MRTIIRTDPAFKLDAQKL